MSHYPFSGPGISVSSGDVRSIVKTMVTFVICIALLGACVSDIDNRISVNEAVQRFEGLAQTDDIVVVRNSNPDWVFGDANDVTFELLIEGKPVTGRCTSGTFSEMVCRLYEGE